MLHDFPNHNFRVRIHYGFGSSRTIGHSNILLIAVDRATVLMDFFPDVDIMGIHPYGKSQEDMGVLVKTNFRVKTAFIDEMGVDNGGLIKE